MMILVKAINEEVSFLKKKEAVFIGARIGYFSGCFVFLFMRFHDGLMGRSRLRWMGNFMGLIHWRRIR